MFGRLITSAIYVIHIILVYVKLSYTHSLPMDSLYPLFCRIPLFLREYSGKLQGAQIRAASHLNRSGKF